MDSDIYSGSFNVCYSLMTDKFSALQEKSQVITLNISREAHKLCLSALLHLLAIDSHVDLYSWINFTDFHIINA